MDDVFDQDVDELTANQNEFKRSMKNVEKEGFVDGIEEGKQKVVQSGFDDGYKIAFEYIYKINFLIGYIRALSNKTNDETRLEQIKSIEETLNSLGEQMLQNLTKGDKNHKAMFDSRMNEIENQLKELNLIKDLDSLFKDE